MSEIGRVNKHKTTHQDGGDDELVLTGILPGVHKSTHQDAGADEIDATGLTGRINYVDRGDPNGYDFEDTDFNVDGDWHNLDLSPIVPEGATAAFLSIYLLDNAAGTYIQFREKGNSYLYNIAFIKTQVANISINGDAFTKLSADRKIEYRTSINTFSAIGLLVRGWFI